MAITTTVVDTTLRNSSTGTTATVTAAPFGTAAADRVIVVAMVMNNTANITGLTIGGVTAVVNGFAGNTFVGSALVPTGTSGDVVATLDASDFFHLIGVASLSGAQDASQFATGNANVNNVTITVPAGGSAVISAVTDGTSTSWTNATQLMLDTSVGVALTSAYFDNSGGSTSRTFTLNSTGATFSSLTASSFSAADALAAQIWL